MQEEVKTLFLQNKQINIKIKYNLGRFRTFKGQSNSKMNLFSRKHRNAFDYAVFLFVPMLLYLTFFIIPNATSYVYSLFDNNGYIGTSHFTFVGLKNFVKVFQDPVFPIAFFNTIKYAVIAVIGQNGLALLFAIFLLKQTKINNFFKTLYYLPAILSSVAIGFTWGFILDPTIGILNVALTKIGLGSLTQSWLGNPKIVMFSIAGIHIWQAVGGAMIIFIAGLLNIPKELYESANIEGANQWQVFKAITFPLLLPVTIINIVLTTIGCFKSFDYVYIMTRGGGDKSSQVLATWLYQEGFEYMRTGIASAIAVILSVTVSILAIIQLNMYKEK